MNLATNRYAQDLRRYYRTPALKVSLTIVLSIFVVSIFTIFALRPTIVSIVKLQKTITESEKTQKILDAKVVNLQKAATQLGSIRASLPILNTIIPNQGATLGSLTQAIEGLALESSVALESETLGSTLLFSRILAPLALNKDQTVIALPFTLRAVGEYTNITAFLTKLLEMRRLIEIDSVTITKESGAKSANSIVSLNIAGSTYYLADQAQLQKILLVPKGKR